MKVTASEIEGSQVVLEMEIEPERFEKAMDRAYRRLVSRVNVPGFRRGKAPRVLVERVLGRDTLITEAIEILVPEAYKEAVRETGIDPVDSPQFDVISAEPLSVKATVPVRPRVELGDYRAIRQSLEIPEISEEQVDDNLESLRQSRAEWVPVERAARPGDMVTVDLVGRVDDRTFLDTQGGQVVLDPEREIVAPGVVERIIGMGSGDRKAFDVTLPESFSEKDLAGRQAVIEVSLSGEVKEKRVPELNDEFARSVGEYRSLEELRSAVRKGLEQQAEAQARRNLEESVLAAVVDQATAEPPATWVEKQAEALRAGTEDQLKREGLTLEQYLRFTNRTEESFREETLSAARRQLKRTLVLDAVADSEGITVGDEEIDTALEEASAGRGGRTDGRDMDRLRSNLRSILRERKTIARLVAIARGQDEEPEDGAEAGRAEAPDAEQGET